MIIGSITITSLDSIGNNVAGDTLIPVVNMDGVPTTQKMTVANLMQAGIGANLGPVANVTISGGTNGYVLQTDGTGNLSWTAQTGGGGNGSVGGANTQVQFNDAGNFGGDTGFTFDKTTGALAVTKLDTATVYHLNGVVVENADLTHGATSALIIPTNGNTTNPAQLNNFYGNVIVTSGVDVDHLKVWTFNANGAITFPNQPTNQRTGSGEALMFAKTGTQKIIGTQTGTANIPVVERLVVAGGDGFDTGEGGDIYLWAGSSGANGGGGGDIKVDGGTGYNGSEGGTIKIRGGQSNDTGNGAGYGGFVEIYAGSGKYGAPVDIRSGQGDSQANSADIRLNTPYGGQWTFDNYGNLTLPSGGKLGYAGMGWTGLHGANTGTPLEVTAYTNTGNTSSQLFLNNNGSLALFTSDEANANSYSWNYNSNGSLTLPNIGVGVGLDEQTVIQSQRKIIPPNRYSALIDGNTPTVVYTASQGSLSLKTTLVVQHAGFGLEMFDVSAVSAGANVIYSVSNRLNATGQPDTTAVVDWDSTQLAITLTVNSGATTSWVTYDSTEFGIAVD